MTHDHSYSSLIGRMLLSTIFLLSGLNKVMDPAGTQGYMTSMGLTWATTLLYLGAVGVELGGGLSLLLGYRTKIGAIALMLFMIPATLIFHTKFSDQNQMIHFLKNLAMIGGLFYVTAYGAGPLSLDRWLKRPRSLEPVRASQSKDVPAQPPIQ